MGTLGILGLPVTLVLLGLLALQVTPDYQVRQDGLAGLAGRANLVLLAGLVLLVAPASQASRGLGAGLVTVVSQGSLVHLVSLGGRVSRATPV